MLNSFLVLEDVTMELVYNNMTNKRGSVWMWIIIVLVVLIIMGIVVYMLMSGDGGSLIGGGGSSIPQPPALPTG